MRILTMLPAWATHTLNKLLPAGTISHPSPPGPALIDRWRAPRVSSAPLVASHVHGAGLADHLASVSELEQHRHDGLLLLGLSHMVAHQLDGLRVEVVLDGHALVPSLGAVQHRKVSRDPHVRRTPATPTASHTRELGDELWRAAAQVAAEALDTSSGPPSGLRSVDVLRRGVDGAFDGGAADGHLARADIHSADRIRHLVGNIRV
mmetsp:Transcript_20104/g.48774  ORF Transcript_20104/g.48774 Transcript_20104/m.48774 type:complete len:206 (+) Transcript_20104:776-1393(+)